MAVAVTIYFHYYPRKAAKKKKKEGFGFFEELSTVADNL